jgi:PKD repeat protein
VLTARYQWDFGDPGSEYNTLVGWNAAHIYNNPGTYTITLTLTNQLNKTRILSTTVTIGQAHYTRSIYVDSVAGKDSNNGSSPSSPIQTIAEVMKLAGSNTQILFHAGETFNNFNGMALPFANVLIGSYGTGSNPILMRQKGVGTTSILLFSVSQNVVIQNITFDSIYKPVGVIADVIPADGVGVAGVDITIRNCTFLNLDDGIHESGNPQGVLIQDNAAPLATGLRGCLLWGQGTDQVILGNSDANSTRQHDIRTVDTIRQLIDNNNLTNLDRRSLGDSGDYSKGTIDVHRGTYAYVSNNWLYDGEMRVGPLSGPSVVAGDTSQWVVFEGNHTFNYQTQVYPGTYHVMFRNNIFTTSSGPDIAIAAANHNGDSISDITFDNNTGISTGVGGQFINIGGGNTPKSVTLVNNLWRAPLVVPGMHMNAGIMIIDKSPAVLALSQNNVFQLPSSFNKYAAGGINYVYPSWLPPHGYYTPAAWNALPFVNHDFFSAISIDGNYTPAVGSVAATAAAQVAGVFVDIYGHARPISGPISAGAVQTGGVQTSDTPPPVTTPPVTTPPVTTTPLATAKTMAVNFTSISGLKGDNFGGLGYAYNGMWASYKLDFGAGVSKITAGIAAIYASGSIEIHLGSPTGTLLGTLHAAVTGKWNDYTAQSTTLSKITGVQTVYLVFKGTVAGICNLDWLQFS